MIALKLNVQSDRDLAMKFGIRYTPTVLTLDGDGKELNRSVGFRPPEEFVPALMLGIGKAHFSNGRFDHCLSILRKLLAEYPRSGSAAAASDLKEACLIRSAQ
jgi:thioredoxin-related protein